MGSPRCVVEQRRELRRIIVAEHPVDGNALGPKPLVGELEPLLKALADEREEQVVQGPGCLHVREFARVRAVGVVAVVGDQPLDGAQLLAVLKVVAGAAEAELEPAAGRAGDRLDRLSGQVTAEHHHIGAVDRPAVEELAEALV